ncbi:hypothetical protein DYB37_005164 [Aphanomyces astaci]|uniref:PDZ domain-containing protein n=1 Tax=Aphanomyces astaci TaxID=112090 RepID=A0A3R7CF73_APHAT|nr:hypothetical protein DYB35_000192 [Aphanomyces astaci]RHZ24289.1 hypothetical protein DYB37_005164 [Aphanomyces astaci]
MTKRVIPMMVAPPPSASATVYPPTSSSKPKATKMPMDRFAMMRQVNVESAMASSADNAVSAGQNHRERLQQESRRRAEVACMEKEDYTFTQEGVDRLKRQEARLTMQEEDKHMRKLMKDEAARVYQALEKERRRVEAEERQVLLDKHKIEMEALKAKQDAENDRKQQDREARMRKMKEASDRKAREEYLANEAVKKAVLEKERQAQQEQVFRGRMQKAAEDALVQAKVAAEEAKWKAWEEAEAAREASEKAARRAQMAAQYEEDKKRRMELHRLRKETENRLKRIEAMDHPTSLPPPSSPPKGNEPPAKSTYILMTTCVPKIGSFCLNPSVDKPPVGEFKDVALLTKEQLRDEHNTCVVCDAFQAKLNRPPTLEEKTEIQPLYKRYSDVEGHLRLVKHRLEGLVADDKAKKAQNSSAFHQLSAAASTSPSATTIHKADTPGSNRKKHIKQEIQDWCTHFQQQHGHPPTVADKKDVQGMYEEYATLDAKIKTLKYSSAETVLVAAVPLAANLSLDTLVGLVHDALDSPTPLPPRELAQRILAIHEAMDGQKCSAFLKVDGVESESPAAHAGLQVGDVVGRFGSVVKAPTATHSTLIRQVVRTCADDI